ncbi:MAG: SDR family oxidoreductase [Rhodospirillaceae bacterium]|jgi:uncharacterized protein YbjT (DUF2867 family)|nr:SDR family oxidoreductase [Rhodospirillaceae bacterium]MBT5240430.1 SDR family oxidoreductase [Rhodospirillaceae bacterium]MBT5566702.1 SDR family oxidoreductase [Rhodospirillaceae bacterium]MBT6090753.1 SDR family oxidoreductase [Rhodospirillaceae bacterium]MBT6959759.1 SDR family oxidoreductase [Rhodospirillaceae bacterium]
MAKRHALTRRRLLAATGMATLLPPAALAQSEIRTVVVAGATGRTGKRIVETLNAQGYRVRGLTRDAARAENQHGNIAEWMSCDVRNPNAVATAIAGMDAVICAIGYTQFAGPNGGQFVDYLGVRHLVDQAIAHKVKHMALISSGSAGPARVQTRNPLFGYVGYWKTKAENRLKTSGLSFTIVGPAGLLDNPGGAHSIRAIKRPEYIKLPMAKRVVDIGDVATVVVASLTNPVLTGKSFALLNEDGPPAYDWRQDVKSLPPEQS